MFPHCCIHVVYRTNIGLLCNQSILEFKHRILFENWAWNRLSFTSMHHFLAYFSFFAISQLTPKYWMLNVSYFIFIASSNYEQILVSSATSQSLNSSIVFCVRIERKTDFRLLQCIIFRPIFPNLQSHYLPLNIGC